MRIILIFILSLGIIPVFGQLVINEYVSANYNTTDNDGDNSDWIEIYNNTANTINLANYRFTDDVNEPAKWIFPSKSISANTFLIIYASGKDRRVVSEDLHTNFKIDNDGEGLYLFDPSNNLVDSIKPVSLPPNVAYARYPDASGNWYYFGTPTPAAPNNTSHENKLELDTVFFSVQGGKHIGGLSLKLSSENPTNKIYYTTDGSDPDKSDILYNGSISITSPTVIRARAYSNNTIPNPIFTNTYVTELDHEFPIVCISTNPENLWDNNTGIFVLGPTYETSEPHYGANYWEDWEKVVNIEYYDEAGTKQFAQIAGMKVFGAWSRMNDQKSVALYARKEYGKGSFNYKLFDSKPIDKFGSFVLRNGGNDYYYLRFQDEFLTSLADGMDIDKQAYRPASVYLNGEYWGIMNIREKINENYFEDNYHVNKDDLTIIEGDGWSYTGNLNEYLALMRFLSDNPSLENSSDYNWLANRIDINNYIQYQLSEIYINNGDWPGNNVKLWKTSSPESKWRWVLYDTDFGFGLYNDDVSFNTLSFALEPNGPGWPNPEWSTRLFRRLVTNPEFTNNFINQFADRINTNFKTSEVANWLNYFQDLYDAEIQYHFNRWGGDYDRWLQLIDDRRLYGIYRPNHARNFIQEVFDLTQQLDVNISISPNNQGKVQLNSIIPKKYPFSGVYFQYIPIKLTAIPNPGYKFLRWEGSVNSTEPTIDYSMSAAGTFKAVFTEATPEDISVVINEINYNSSDAYASKDWIEILNNGKTSVDLTDWLLSDSGTDTGFVFPSGLILSPGEYYVIYSDAGSFKSTYPNVTNSCGKLPFGLSSNGDQIFLYDDSRNLIDYVNYDVTSPWDNNANGTGLTLELINPAGDNNLAKNWRAGIPGGTPGEANQWATAAPSYTAVLKDKFLNCFPNPFKDYTTINFDITKESDIRLEVYDMSGSLVEVLISEHLVPDSYYYDWYGTNSEGKSLAAGIYTIRLSDNANIINFKVVKL